MWQGRTLESFLRRKKGGCVSVVMGGTDDFTYNGVGFGTDPVGTIAWLGNELRDEDVNGWSGSFLRQSWGHFPRS